MHRSIGEGEAAGVVPKLELDELLRLERGRAEDAAALVTAARCANVAHALESSTKPRLVGALKELKKTLAASEIPAVDHVQLITECKLREAWRRPREERCLAAILLEADAYEKTRVRLMQYVQPAAHALNGEDPALEPFLCLSSWNRSGRSLRELVELGQNHHWKLLAWFEAKLSGSATQGVGSRMPEPSERPGSIAKKVTRHRVAQFRQSYSAYVLQLAVQKFLCRRRSQKRIACSRILAWYKRYKERNTARNIMLCIQMARKIQRAWSKCLFRRRSTLLQELREDDLPSQESIVRVQSVLRVWLAKAHVRQLMWFNSQLQLSRLSKQWRLSRKAWGSNQITSQLTDAAQGRLEAEKQVLELDLLIEVEQKRCAAQLERYEKRVTQSILKSKLPAGWVEHEVDEDERHENGGVIRQKFLNLKTGKVVFEHPNVSKVTSLCRAAQAKAETVTQHQTAKLEEIAWTIKLEDRVRVTSLAHAILHAEGFENERSTLRTVDARLKGT